MYPTNFSRLCSFERVTPEYKPSFVNLTIKIHSTGTVRVDFLYHEVQILGGVLVVLFLQDLSQNCGWD
jgi:hypothetical protein